ncbi:DUF3397 domain-containing protein [Streptococcus dentiloxodontae]
MTIYKLFALAFLVLTPIFSYIVCSFFKSKRSGFNFADLSTFLYIFEIFLVSSEFFTHSFLPYYTIMMSSSAIFITLRMLRKSERFVFKRFIKLFWRIGFFITFLFYLATIFIIFSV